MSIDGRGRKILVLEDEPAVQTLILKQLTSQGFQVTVAGRRSKAPFSADVTLRLKSPEQRAREARARMLEATIRQLEAQLSELKRQLKTLTDAP